MKILKRLALVLLGLLAVAVIVALLYVRGLSSKGLPDYNAEVVLEGMSSQVTVYRDGHGVPHIYAENEADLYRATGYVMAQDRLWQMDLFRRVTTGRLSEIFGPDLIETDMLMRALRISEKSETVLSRLEAEILASLVNYTDGINQYIDQNLDKLPLEFSILGYKPEHWAPIYTLNLISYMAWDLTAPWSAETVLFKLAQKLGLENPKLKDLIPDFSLHDIWAYPEFKLEKADLELGPSLLSGSRWLADRGLTPFSGSNNWAVSGKKSVSGKPLFANDMHLGLNVPGIWYQMHQVIKGELDVTGVCLAGAPAVVAGHNLRIAWGMTNAMVDDMDFYLETIHPDNPDLYSFQGEWREMEVRKEMIPIKGGAIEERTLRFTHRGPIVSGFKGIQGHALSMRWIGNEFSNEVRAVYQLNRAGNWEEFKDAVRGFFAISQNMIYADVEGNIGLYYCAGVPIRKGEGIFVNSGETDEYDWQGFVPFEELPHEFNPARGYVSSANNRSVGDEYPYYLSHWFFLPYRIDRIREMLEAKEKLSVEDFKSMHADLQSKLVDATLEPILTELRNLEGKSEEEDKVLEMLMSWEGALTQESPAALVFEKMRFFLIKNMALDELGEDLFDELLNCSTLRENLLARLFRLKGSPWCDDELTPDIQESFSYIVQKSFQDSVQALSNELGGNPEDWEWGKVHRVYLQHPLGSVKLLDRIFRLNRGPYQVGGSFHTVCPFSYNFKSLQSVYGASHRHIFTLEDWNKSWTVIPTGTSGVPSSPYYCDQTELYLEGRYHPDLISRPLIETAARYEMLISAPTYVNDR